MKICEYGCGQEAKFYFPTVDKWCCSEHYRQCPVRRKETSIQKEKEWQDPNSGLNSDLCRDKRSDKMKEKWENPDSEYNLDLCKKKQSNKKREVWEDPDSVYNSTLYRNKLKLTIEQIQQKYKTFSAEEEMRYNPDKPEEKEIQVHCKNHLCPNSKEKSGWFTPKKQELKNRIYALDKDDGNDGHFLYCSQYCKDICPCCNVINDPLQLAEYQQYLREVQKSTYLSVKYNSNKILNIELRGRKCGYDLDHKFSIKDGFNNNINPEIIGHWKNLEIIKAFDNKIKSRGSSISINEIHRTGTECSTGNLADKVLPGCKIGGQE